MCLGGPDSICLVDVLYDISKDEDNSLNYDIIVCHVNHMIREEALADEEFVKNYCIEKGISFYSKKIDVIKLAKEQKIGTEEAGRQARYEFFSDILEKTHSTKIATAHTKSDNAETVLMNILRGTGSFGLKGISAKRDEIFIKPLIKVSREEIEEYCINHDLNPRRDKTNDENIYTRNKIRNVLIPEIEKDFNPNIVDTLDRLSEIMEVQADYFEGVTEEVYKKILIKEEKKEIILDLREYNKCHYEIKSRIILYAIKKLLGTTQGISKIHIDDIIRVMPK